MLIKPNYITASLYLMMPFCFIDMLNGYLIVEVGNIPLSATYKILLCIIFILPILRRWDVSVLLCICLFSLNYQSSLYTLNLLEDFSTISRTLLFFFTVIFFYECRFLLTDRHLKIIKLIFVISFCILTINVVGGLFGFGYTTYGGKPAAGNLGLGFKGFFYAGNELGALLICLYPVVRLTVCKQTQSLKIVLINMLFLLSSGLIGTKTSFFGILILVIIDLRRLFFQSYVGIFSGVLIFSVFINTMAPLFIKHFDSRIESLEFFYETRGALYLLLSGRDEFITDAVVFISNTYSTLDYFLGIGSSYANSSFKSTEVDFFDLFVWNGFFWSLGVYIFYLLFSRLVINKIIWTHEKVLVTCTLTLLFFVSIFAGHVMTSAMLLPFLALYFPYFYIRTHFE